MDDRTRFLADWRSRVQALEQLLVSQPEYAWLWEIRLKIMKFLIARYGTGPITSGVFSQAESESMAPLRFAVHARPTLPPSPPQAAKKPQELRELLEDIHEAVPREPVVSLSRAAAKVFERLSPP